MTTKIGGKVDKPCWILPWRAESLANRAEAARKLVDTAGLNADLEARTAFFVRALWWAIQSAQLINCDPWKLKKCING